MERAERFGVPMEHALHLFMGLWGAADQRIGHNEGFDARMLRIELLRHAHYAKQTAGALPFADHWKSGDAYCTANSSTKIVNLPPSPKMIAAKRFHPKMPNLGEAYEFFTGEKLVGAHNAMVDVQAAKRVYYGIRNHGKDAA